MTARVVLNYALVFAAVLYSAFTPQCFSPCKGDVNGDDRVNVLDAQKVVGALLLRRSVPEGADANHDGQVDILDLQCVLALMNHPAGQPLFPRQPAPHAIVAASAELAVRHVAIVVESVTPDVEQRRWGHAEFRPTFSRHTERYLLTLTANAPPCHA